MTLARLRDASSCDVADYLSARGYFRTAPFRVSRFVLFSSRASVGGGPYVVEASYPLSQRERLTPASNSRDCSSRMALAMPWPSAIASRISDRAVERGGSTSPITLPKSKLELGVEFARQLLHAPVVGQAVHVQRA